MSFLKHGTLFINKNIYSKKDENVDRITISIIYGSRSEKEKGKWDWWWASINTFVHFVLWICF